jgi:hypothetical protein
MRTLMDVSPLLETPEWNFTAQVARDTVQFIQ